MSIIVAVRKHGEIVIARSAVMAACALDDSCAEPIHTHSITIN